MVYVDIWDARGLMFKQNTPGIQGVYVDSEYTWDSRG